MRCFRTALKTELIPGSSPGGPIHISLSLQISPDEKRVTSGATRPGSNLEFRVGPFIFLYLIKFSKFLRNVYKVNPKNKDYDATITSSDLGSQ